MTLPSRFVVRGKCEKVYEEPINVLGTLGHAINATCDHFCHCVIQSTILLFLSPLFLPSAFLTLPNQQTYCLWFLHPPQAKDCVCWHLSSVGTWYDFIWLPGLFHVSFPEKPSFLLCLNSYIWIQSQGYWAYNNLPAWNSQEKETSLGTWSLGTLSTHKTLSWSHH